MTEEFVKTILLSLA